MSNEEILLRTLVYFEGVSSVLQKQAGSEIATNAIRFGMIIAIQHPEYAQAYYRMTQGMSPEADALEDEVIRDFISSVPLKTVVSELGADQEESKLDA